MSFPTPCEFPKISDDVLEKALSKMADRIEAQRRVSQHTLGIGGLLSGGAVPQTASQGYTSATIKSPGPSLYEKLAMRMGWQGTERRGVSLCGIQACKNKNNQDIILVVIIAPKGQYVCIEDDEPDIFPSDKIVRQIRLLEI